jgi:hypothetical protein
MTGNAILRGGLEIRQGLVLYMAMTTCHLGMISCQLEGDGIVIEIMAKSIHSIMTSQAICPVILYMALSKAGIYLSMTFGAIVLVITGVVLGMAIDTNEWRSITFNLVSGQ